MGYTAFVAVWVPRVLTTLKARAFLTRYALVGLVEVNAWPEIVLLFAQFGGLVWLLSGLSLVGQPDRGLTLLSYTPPARASFARAGGLPVENFFRLWVGGRGSFFFRPAATELTCLTVRVLNGFVFFVPGKQFPVLLSRLHDRLTRETKKLSHSGGVGLGG